LLTSGRKLRNHSGRELIVAAFDRLAGGGRTGRAWASGTRRAGRTARARAEGRVLSGIGTSSGARPGAQAFVGFVV
jgi:hypothetical protein